MPLIDIAMKQEVVPGAAKCPKCGSRMDESFHDSIEIAECYFCGFRLIADQQEGETQGLPRDEAALVTKR